MPDRDDVQALVERYVQALDSQDVEGVLALFASDGAHDDVTGAGRYVGPLAIRGFLEPMFSVGFAAQLDGPVAIHGSTTAFRVVIEVPAGRTPFRLLVSAWAEVEHGLLASLRTVTDSRVLNV